MLTQESEFVVRWREGGAVAQLGVKLSAQAQRPLAGCPGLGEGALLKPAYGIHEF